MRHASTRRRCRQATSLSSMIAADLGDADIVPGHRLGEGALKDASSHPPAAAGNARRCLVPAHARATSKASATSQTGETMRRPAGISRIARRAHAALPEMVGIDSEIFLDILRICPRRRRPKARCSCGFPADGGREARSGRRGAGDAQEGPGRRAGLEIRRSRQPARARRAGLAVDAQDHGRRGRRMRGRRSGRIRSSPTTRPR